MKYKDQYTSVVYASATRRNEEPTGTIELLKVDSETGSTPQGDATFENAYYELYADEDIYNVAKTIKYYSKGDLVAKRTMTKAGTTEIIENLPLGRFKMLEKNSSEGYLLDTKEHIIELKYKDQYTKVISETVTSKEVVKKMRVHFFKSGINTQSGMVQGLGGVEFSLKLASEVENAMEKGYTYEEIWNGIDKNGNKVNVDSKRVAEAQVIAPTYDTVTTDENGDCYTSLIPYGRYIRKGNQNAERF